jgi:hypothetical protein
MTSGFVAATQWDNFVRNKSNTYQTLSYIEGRYLWYEIRSMGADLMVYELPSNARFIQG